MLVIEVYDQTPSPLSDAGHIEIPLFLPSRFVTGRTVRETRLFGWPRLAREAIRMKKALETLPAIAQPPGPRGSGYLKRSIVISVFHRLLFGS